MLPPHRRPDLERIARVGGGNFGAGLLNNIAWVRAATKVCTEADPAFSGHLVAAYDAWLAQSPQLAPLISWLDQAPQSAEQAKVQERYAKAYAKAYGVFDGKRNDADDLANQCDTTTKELAEGVYDPPEPSP